MRRSSGVCVDEFFDFSESTTNWKFVCPSAFCLYILASTPKSCADEMEMRFSRSGMISTFAANRVAKSMGLCCWS